MTCFPPKSQKQIAIFLLRISFGLSLLFVGLAHYMTFNAFKIMTTNGLGALEVLGTIWAFIMPALMIIGGALFVIGKYDYIAALTGGLALASIPAGVLLKSVVSGAPLPDMMPMAINAFIWLIIYAIVVLGNCKKCCEQTKNVNNQ